MNKLNTILNTIFVASIVLSTVAFGIAVVVFEPGKLLGDLFCLWILIVLFAIVGLLLSPEEDLYDGYIPEPDRSKEYEQIQRNLYDKGYDMSKDIKYSDDDIESTHELECEL